MHTQNYSMYVYTVSPHTCLIISQVYIFLTGTSHSISCVCLCHEVAVYTLSVHGYMCQKQTGILNSNLMMTPTASQRVQ